MRQREGVRMKHALALLLILVCSTLMRCKFALANSDGTVYLERGRRGIVPCPPIASSLVTLQDADAVYWYSSQIHKRSLLISYFRGNVAPQNGIPEGVYDIDREFSLIIERVSPADEGIYVCQVKPRMTMVESGYVGVYEKVSTSHQFPIVFGCDQRPLNPDQCDVPTDTDTPMSSLTCVVEAVKPAAELRWFRVFADGSDEPVDASQTVRTVVLPPNRGSALRNHTFTTSASIQLTSVNDDVKYRCEAHGVAVGNESHVIVSFVRAPSITAIYSEAQLPENTRTTPALTDESSAKMATDKPAQPDVRLIVVITLSLAVNLILILVLVYRRTRRYKTILADRKSDVEFKPVSRRSSVSPPIPEKTILNSEAVLTADAVSFQNIEAPSYMSSLVTLIP